MTKEDQFKKELARVLLNISGARSMDAFLEDLLTPGEYGEIARRWQLVKQLDKGIPQRQIAEDLGVGIATVTRGSRELRDPNGGFRKVLHTSTK